MLRPPPRATHTDPLFPYPTLFRSADFWQVTGDALDFALEASFGPGAAPAGLRPALMDSYLALDAYPEVQGVLETLKAAGMRTARSEEHTSELQSLMRISYAVFCLKKKKQ